MIRNGAAAHSDSRKDLADSRNELADQEQRDWIRERLDETLFVEAAAGTGKTTALVGRIVALLRQGRATLKEIVAVTFTDKAAGEMKLRLRGEIGEARSAAAGGSAERDRLERALEQLELARIGTIHGFCKDILVERPVEAGVDPAFSVAGEEEAARILDTAFNSWFRSALEDPGPGVRRALRRQYPRGSGGPRAALRAAAARLIEHRDFEARWSRPPQWNRERELDDVFALLQGVAAYARRAEEKDDYLVRNLRHIEEFVHDIRLRDESHGRDYDYLEASLRGFVRQRWRGWHWMGRWSNRFGGGVTALQVREERDRAKAEAERVLGLVDAEMAADLRDELRPVVKAYEAAKRREGCLDFVDLLIRARDLLRDEANVRYHYQRRFKYFLVDEFQDTDPLQAEILLLLCSDDPDETDRDAVIPKPGKLFIVGDPKQSIYRFRRADVMLYERTKSRLAAAGAAVLQLSTSFRSQPRLQAAVNGAFEPRMTGSTDGSRADYVPLVPHRADVGRQPAVIALPVPAPYAPFGKITKKAIEASLPEAVGAFVTWLVRDSGWRVTSRERADKTVPVESRHVCLLFRRFQSRGEDVTRPYVRELEAREVPHVLVGGRSYHDREEVLAVRNALTAIEWPDDRLSVYAALRGPLFSLGDRALFEYGAEVGPLHPLAVRDDDHADGHRADGLRPDLGAVADVLKLLGDLHRMRNRRPLAETVLRLLSEARAHAGIAIWPTGEQALANVLRISDRARAFERSRASSFRAFLHYLENEAASGHAEEAPIVEEGTDGVRMMTVHKAKGLEFPVVVLADMTCGAAVRTPRRHIDSAKGLWAESLCGAVPYDVLKNRSREFEREMAEADRLAYVAATRARDILVVSALGDGRDGKGGATLQDDEPEWWLESLNRAVYPPLNRRRPGSASRAAAARTLGIPNFGAESVVSRPGRNGVDLPTPPASVEPGRHQAKGGNEVVWWDPNALDLDHDPRAGDKQKTLLEAEGKEQRSFDVEESVRAHDEWRRSREDNIGRGSRRKIAVRSVRSLAGAASEDEGESGPQNRSIAGADIGWVRVARPAAEGEDGEGRPGGQRFGSLVHRVLAEISLDAGRDDVKRLADALGRNLGCPPSEVGAAAALAIRVLGHEVLRRARAAEREDPANVRREVPVFLATGSGAAGPGESSFPGERGVGRPADPGESVFPGERRQASLPSEHGAESAGSDGPENVVEGVVDIAFREVGESGPRWVVADYKTDRGADKDRPVYERQVAWYAEAVRRATGEPVTGIVLVI